MSSSESNSPEPSFAAIASATVFGVYVAFLVDRLGTPTPWLGSSVYLAVLAVVLGTLLAIVGYVASRVRTKLAVAGLVLVSVGAAIRPAIRFAASERLAELGVPHLAVFGAAALFFAGAIVAGGALAFSRERRLARVVLVALAAAVAVSIRRVPQHYFDLRLLGSGLVTVFAAASVEPTLRARARLAARLLAGVALGALLTGLVFRGDLVEARHQMLVRRGFIGRVDGWFMPPDRSVLTAARVDIAAVDPRRCASAPVPSTPSGPPPNVLVLSIDALRRDAVGRVVRGRPVTPSLDALARRAQSPRDATTHYAATLFSLASAYTGYTPTRVALAPHPYRTIFGRLAERGVRTTLVLPLDPYFDRPMVRAYLTQDTPLRRAERSPALVDAILDEVRIASEQHRAFAIGAHLGEPHASYERHTGFDFGDDEVGRYLGEVAFVDHELGRLVAALDSRGELARTLVVVFADHGESLGERDHFGHHQFLYHAIADIPFFVLAPASLGRIAASSAQPSDIAATIAAAYGVDLPFAAGHDLFTPREREAPAMAEAFSTGAESLAAMSREDVRDLDDLVRRAASLDDGFGSYPPLVSIVDARYRLVVGRRDGIVELYDRKVDPLERTDLALRRTDVRRRMLAALASRMREESAAVRCTFERARGVTASSGTR